MRWLMIGLVFLATIINFIDRLTVSVLAPVIVKDLNLSNQDYAQIASWFLVAYSISHAVSGRIIDRIGTRKGFAFSITLWSLAAMAHATARSGAALGFFRFLLGFGEAGNWPGAAKVCREWFPVKERVFAMSIFNSGAALGSVVAPPVIIYLQLHFGWQATFLVTGSLGFAWLLLWLALYRSNPDAEVVVDTAPTPWGLLLRERNVWGILLARFFTDPVWWLYLNWLPLYLSKVHGLDLKSLAWAAPAPFLAADAGSLLSGGVSAWLIHRGWAVQRARRFQILIGVACMASGVGVIWSHNVFTALAWISAATFGFQFWVNNVQTLPSDFFPAASVGSVAGMGGLGAGFGALLFTLSTGWLVDHFGYTPVLAIVAVLPLAGLLCLLLLSDKLRSNT